MGEVPTISLNMIESPLYYSAGEAISQSITAIASDADGQIADVEFFLNGELFNTDSASPYTVDLELNATGHFEIYAVARDNVGNISTSNVRRIIVIESDETAMDPLVISAPETNYLGGISQISATYQAPDKYYNPNIYALVYIDGESAGLADVLPYEEPAPGASDPGQSFTFDLLGSSTGIREVEFVIVNGTTSETAMIEVDITANPFVDDTSFIFELYRGLFNRDPVGYEQNYWVNPLGNGTITRAQILEGLREKEEFRKAVQAIISHKTVVGNWVTISDILGSIQAPTNTSDDHANIEENATTIFFNQTVQASIDNEMDVDWFKIESLTPNGNDGILNITILPGHPHGLNLHSWNWGNRIGRGGGSINS